MINHKIPADDPLVCAREARKQLGNISNTTLWRWTKRGIITLTSINGRNYTRQSTIDAIKEGGAGSGVVVPPGAKKSARKAAS
jgi:hypothetical protein